MLFPTIEFAIFFPVVLAISWLLMPRQPLWKPFIVVASYVFYAAADPRFQLHSRLPSAPEPHLDRGMGTPPFLRRCPPPSADSVAGLAASAGRRGHTPSNPASREPPSVAPAPRSTAVDTLEALGWHVPLSPPRRVSGDPGALASAARRG